jgi:hypothetical protein
MHKYQGITQMEETSQDRSEFAFMDHLFELLLKRQQAYQRYERFPSKTNLMVYNDISGIVSLLHNSLTLRDHYYMWN